jgi:predicted acyltransferase
MDERPERWSALDNLRGLTVLLMIPVNAGMDFASIPAWFTHAPGRGLTLADFIMPAFLFALGTSASFSFRRRLAEKGLGRTVLHALRRSARWGATPCFATSLEASSRSRRLHSPPRALKEPIFEP